MDNTDNKQLHKKFQRKETFYKEMQGISKKYLEFQQQVYYSPIKDFNPNMIIKIQSNPSQKRSAIFGKKQDFYIINGQYQPSGQRGFQRLILQLVQTIPRPTKTFGMIYVNTLADGNAYNDFKKILQLLPVQFFFHLTKIYVLQPTFFSKASSWLSFGTISNYIKNKTIYVQNLKELSRETHFDFEYLMKILPINTIQQLKKQHKASNLRREEVSNSNIIEITTMEQHYKSNPKKEITSNILDQMPATYQPQSKSNKKEIEQYEIGPTGAPRILEMLIYYFTNKQQSLKLEGIFRKSVSIDDETEILKELNDKNYNYLQKVNDPHIIANAIKRFLSYLKTPIVPFKMFQIFMTKENDPNFENIIVENIKSLPHVHRMSLFLLFDFLKNKALTYAEYSKMGENNMCIVFGPCLMRSEVSSIQDLIYAKKIIVATSKIFHNFEAIFGDKNEQNKIKRVSYREYNQKQILQRLDEDQKKFSPQKQQNNKPSVQNILLNGKKQQLAQDEPTTPTFPDIAIFKRTSQFIKESLQNSSNDDLDFDDGINHQEMARFIPHFGVESQKNHLSVPGENKVNQSKYQTQSVKYQKTPQKVKSGHFTQI